MTYTDTYGRRDYDEYGYGRFPTDLDRLSNLDDWEVADDEVDPRGYDLIGRDGDKIGTIKDLLASTTAGRAFFAIVDTGGWFENKLFAVPLEEVRFDPDDGKAYSPYIKEQFREAPEYRDYDRDWNRYYGYWSGFHTAEARPVRGEAVVEREREYAEPVTTERAEGVMRVPVTEEEARVRKVQRTAGFVTLRKRTDVETEHISEPVTRTRVVAETREVPAGEAYDVDERASTLREGESIRVPIVEEEVVVEKVPRVTKEVVLRTETDTEQVERDVQLRHEEVVVDEEGEVDEAVTRRTDRDRRR